MRSGRGDVAWGGKKMSDLSSHLPNTVYELNEERRALRVGVVLVTVTNTLEDKEHRQKTFNISLSVN